MDYDETIEKLIAEFNLDSEIGRKKAYQKCMQYADRELDLTLDYNPFLDAAAERLEQAPERKDIARRMVEQTGGEKLHLTYRDETGPELTGNAAGLSYLSEVLKHLSKATMNGEHSHFFAGQPPLCGNSYPLTVYLEDEDWFAEHAQDNEMDEQDGDVEHEFRDIDVDSIEAFMLSGKVIVDLVMTPGKIYRVSDCRKYEDQDVWVKSIREETDRVFVFQFMCDAGEPQQLALDIDDREVAFFEKERLSQLI